MKNVYFVQANYLYGNSAYLPYAAGSIAAFAWQQLEVRENYKLKRFVFLREKIDDAIASFEEPYLVAFSNYVWNFEYNKAFAKKLKHKYPSCLIVFGGHNVPFDRDSLLRECAYIDFLVHEEGEKPFSDLLIELLHDRDFSRISNLSYRNNDKVIIKTENVNFSETDYPSPYLDGLFDSLFDEYDYEFSATLETNRGCPFSCTFCDWGTLRGKLRKFPMTRIKAEIDWMAKHKIDHVYCADANFGIFDRDERIVDLLIESKAKTGFPNKFRVCYTKSSDEKVFNLNKRLDEKGMSKGATLSFQSVSSQVLKNIDRKNLTLERFSQLMALYNEAAIPSNSELILALPGETYDSFCRGVGLLLEAGQHTSLNIYHCELLPNSKMANSEYIKEFGIKTVTTALGRNHCDSNEVEEISELSEIVCETAAMSSENWILANLFALVVQSYHCFGLLQCFSMYLFHEQKIKYEDFYKAFLDWISQNTKSVAGEIFLDIKGRLNKILANNGSWSYVNPIFGDIIWPFEEGIFLETVYKFDDFYSQVIEFLKQYKIEEEIFNDLLAYQKGVIKLPFKDSVRIELEHDLYHYFSAIYKNTYAPIKKQKNIVFVTDNQRIDSWPDYAREIVWYGRKGNKNVYTKLEVEYI